MTQAGFFFDAPLEHDPVSQLPPLRPLSPFKTGTEQDKQEFIARVRLALTELDYPAELTINDVLGHVGLNPVSMIAWHRSRVLDVLMEQGSRYKSYPREGQPPIFKRER